MKKYRKRIRCLRVFFLNGKQALCLSIIAVVITTIALGVGKSQDV